ncbi:hypothetical protein SAMD00079811_50600 [Scytonema sp. HK-05]|nr:hypothetical protein SAMD00079811_50600 [Scytonema sp. HK-05]
MTCGLIDLIKPQLMTPNYFLKSRIHSSKNKLTFYKNSLLKHTEYLSLLNPSI